MIILIVHVERSLQATDPITEDYRTVLEYNVDSIRRFGRVRFFRNAIHIHRYFQLLQAIREIR